MTIAMGVVLLSAVLSEACGTRAREEALGQTQQALTADTARVFGFESASDWTSSAPVTLVNRHSQGSHALQVTTSSGSASVTSAPVSGPLEPTSLLAVDLIVPHLQSPTWHGQAQLSVTAPSVGVYNEWIGAVAFPFPYTTFQRIAFPISSAIQQRLGGSFSDLRATITVTGGAGAYVLDNLRFITAAEAASPVASRVSNESIMNFEDPNLWVAFAPTQLGSSDARISGSHSMTISNSSWTQIDSARLSGPMAAKGFMAFDFLVPSPQPQWWRGSLSLIASIPSRGVNGVSIGQLDLLSFPVDALTRVVFPVPSALGTALSRTFTDLTFTFVLNVPSGISGNYVLDYLRLVEDPTDPERPVVTGTEPPFTVAIPPVAIPPLGGTGQAAIDSARNFINWAVGARASQIAQARTVVKNAASNAEIVQALINEVNLANFGPWDRYAVTLAILGETQTQAANNFFTQILDLPLPPTGVRGLDDRHHHGPAADFAHVALQVKAVDGLAFARSPSGNQKLLQVIHDHPSAAVRIEAIRAYMQANGPAVRPTVLAAARPAEQVYVDSFPRLNETDQSSFDDQLNAWLATHPAAPEPVNPAD
jgi:hypothetical protein